MNRVKTPALGKGPLALLLTGISLSLACGGGGSGSSTDQPANKPPTITSTAPTAGKEGHPYAYTPTATDPEGSTVTFTLTAAPTGATLTAGVVNWVPTAGQVGAAQSFTLSASDGKGGTVTQTWSVTPSANGLPSFTSTAPASAKAGHPYAYTVAASDADSDPVTYQLVAAPTGATFTGTTLSWTPTAGQASAAQSFTLRASDGFGGTKDQTWSVTPSANALPTFTSTAPASAKEGHPYAYTIAATDADSDPLTIQLISGPAGATLTGTALSWTPTAGQASAAHSFTLRASDGFGGTQDQTWSVTPSVNALPFISSAAPLTADQETGPYSYTLAATDADGDALTYTLVSGPAGASFTGNTLNWTIQPAQARVANAFQVQVADGFGGTSAQNWTVTPAGPVQISRVISYELTSGAKGTQPVDLATLAPGTIQAYIPDSLGGFTLLDTFSATNPGAGKLSSIPGGYFWLKFGTQFIWTNASSVDLGYDSFGRQDKVLSNISPTTLSFSVTNLSNWNSASDDLQLTIPNTGYWNTLLDPTYPLSNAPLDGDIALAGTSLDWFNHHLLDQSKGDALYLTQLTTKTSGMESYQTIERFMGPTAITQSDGTPSTVNGTFTAVPQTSTFTFNWARDQFAQFKSQINPAATSYLEYFVLDAHPTDLSKGMVTNTPDMFVYNSFGATSALNLGAVSYGNPFPGTWTPFVVAGTLFRRSYLLPGTTTPTKPAGQIYAETPTLPTASNPLVPFISPVQAPKVDGNDAYGDVYLFGSWPTVSWTAPTLGTPAGYIVSVYHLTVSGTRTVRSFVASLRTKGTSLQLPPSLLQFGESYHFQIRAYHAPGIDFATAPFRRGADFGIADTFTGIITR